MQANTTEILEFLQHIKLPMELCKIEQHTFLPGLRLEKGILQIDTQKLLYPGDILHEAGHIAVCEPTERHLLSDNVYQSGRNKDWMHGEEMAAIAWSVAAIEYIGLPLDVVFHPHGYKGQSQSLINAFSNNTGFGFPLLGAWEMLDPQLGYPHMQKWLREVSWV
ncbi:hypothetical protein PSECIP111951_03777 [Pseudoalteromonas holothuriae]|uniref:Uncharacterized protein n=2 Tax=Pseudoalteromonas holothuriae TaxID=2963714 RepID=A0A9W4VQU2_9GAMM|nr:hypothetical protein [Pseudoalteromonas sp. CIP111854]CAH9049557.1 hypothetical protein PSECIP111854_00199 [Pseudoalteromonas sp. CIP111854]CAH9067370.1 hypothetical protein PSECIP111951_03777 [Pseudoalteromonas sp. CIP111951]